MILDTGSMNRNLSPEQFKSVAHARDSADDYCPSCEFDHRGPCESNGRPAIRRGEIE